MVRVIPAAFGGMLLATALALPLAAQQSAPPSPGTPTAPGAALPDETVSKAGAALRQVTVIRQTYTPRIASASSDKEKQSLRQQAMDEAAKAVNDQGLSIDQYNQVMRLAEADPSLEQRLVTAAKTTK
jgi:hypothetical protein